MRGGNQCRTGSGTDSAAYACNNETEETELNKAVGKNPGAGYGGRV